ncbi:lamin tail domain-containing protein [bacterium]|nr:lamin tail domain-containing protein [bacterium]
MHAPWIRAVICTALAAAGSAGGQVRINEIMFDPLGDEGSGEFIEIINTGDTDVDMSGWCVGDSEGRHRIAAISGPLVLAGGQYGIIFSDAYFSGSRAYDALIPATALLIAAEGTYLGSRGLSNSRPETVIITDSRGTVQDSCRYSIGNDPGLSDERVDPRRDIWLDSCTLHGTPGFLNSVHAGELPGRARLKAVPNCISSSFSGLSAVTDIRYSLPMLRSYIMMRVFTLQGRCIRTLTSGSYTGSSGSLEWDGCGDDGVYVSAGIYLVQMEGLESSSGKRAAALCPVTVFTP